MLRPSSGLIELQTLDCSDAGIEECARIVKNGGVIVFPTDTVYGIGCDPYNDSAVKRVFSIKGRAEGKSLPVLTGNVADAENIVSLGPAGKRLAERFWPGALTIVAPLRDTKISTSVTAGKRNLAVRVPANKCTLRLLEKCRYLVGTSANLSGRGAPKDAQSVSLFGFDAMLVDREPLGGRESTVADVSRDSIEILRQGALSEDVIRKALE